METASNPFRCVTFVILQYTDAINDNGPVAQLQRHVWTLVMNDLERLDFVRRISWATCQDAKTLFIILDHSKTQDSGYTLIDATPDDNVKTITCLLHQLHPFLDHVPRLLNSVISYGSIGPTILDSTASVLDIYAIHSVMQALPETIRKRASLGTTLQTYVDPLAYRLTLQSYLDGHGSAYNQGYKPTDDGDLRSYVRTYQLPYFGKQLQPDDICEEVIAIGWKSFSARKRFQSASMASSVARQTQAPPYNAWHVSFGRPLQEMKDSGKVHSVELWTMQIRPWPAEKKKWSNFKKRLPWSKTMSSKTAAPIKV